VLIKDQGADAQATAARPVMGINAGAVTLRALGKQVEARVTVGPAQAASPDGDLPAALAGPGVVRREQPVPRPAHAALERQALPFSDLAGGCGYCHRPLLFA
jgi:hypothetical protein